jgi:hypothetical protein
MSIASTSILWSACTPSEVALFHPPLIVSHSHSILPEGEQQNGHRVPIVCLHDFQTLGQSSHSFHYFRVSFACTIVQNDDTCTTRSQKTFFFRASQSFIIQPQCLSSILSPPLLPPCLFSVVPFVSFPLLPSHHHPWVIHPSLFRWHAS